MVECPICQDKAVVSKVKLLHGIHVKVAEYCGCTLGQINKKAVRDWVAAYQEAKE